MILDSNCLKDENATRGMQLLIQDVTLDAILRAYKLESNMQEDAIRRFIEKRTFQEQADCLRRMLPQI